MKKRNTGIKETSPKNQLRLKYQWDALYDKQEYFLETPQGNIWADKVTSERIWDAKLVLEYDRSPFNLNKNDATDYLKGKVRKRLVNNLLKYKAAMVKYNKKELVIVCNEHRVQPYFEQLFKETDIKARFVVYKPEFEKYEVRVTNKKYQTTEQRRFIQTVGCQWFEK